MTRFLLISLTLLVLSGCGFAYNYSKPGVSQQQAAQDNFECKQASQQLGIVGTGGMLVGGSGPSWDTYKECMEARGYSITAGTEAPKEDDSAHGQNRLGVKYQNQVPQDYWMARIMYEKAAAQGNADAQYNLGLLYRDGNHVPQDYVQARQWFEKAAAQGNANAQTNLGGLYGNGQGVSQDYGKARQWFEQAAAQGNAWALSNLGWLYANGNGVPQDYVRAYMWYNVAAAHSMGNDQKLATDTRDKIASLITPAQIAEAQRLSQQCQARQFKGC